MDAFAAAVCKGLSIKEKAYKDILTVGFYFGLFQALMPILGYVLGKTFESVIDKYDHWVAFFLLGFIGINMILESRENTCKPGCTDRKSMIILAIATSIDAFAVGVSFAFLHIDIVTSSLLIGATTFFLSLLGVRLGNVFGMRYKQKAELVGGIILIFMGLKILIANLLYLA